MSSFRGKFTNKLDAKGRVSVPSKFRTVAQSQGMNGIYCFRSFKGPFLEAGGPALNAEIDALLDGLGTFSDELNELAAVLVAESDELLFDADGRVLLSEELREHAGLEEKGQVTFVGMRRKFQIWEPSAYERFRQSALEAVRHHDDLLRSPSAPRRPITGGDG